MTDTVVIGLTEIAVEMEGLRYATLPEAIAVVSKGSLNVKKGWQQRWKGNRHAPALAYAVGYDVTTTPGAITGTIGPDKDRRQGPLGSLVEFGSVNNAPTPGGAPALDDEAPRFEAAVDALAKKLLP